jgi:hypothetical protein
MPTNGRRFVLHALVLLAILGVVLSTGWVVFWPGFTLDSEGPSQTMVRQEALAAAIGCALLVANVTVLRALRIARWLVVADAALAGLLALVAVLLGTTDARGPDLGDGNPWTWVGWMFLVAPTTWPVLGLLLAMPWVRGRSRRAPRAPQDR